VTRAFQTPPWYADSVPVLFGSAPRQRKSPPAPESAAGEALPIWLRRGARPNDSDFEFIVRFFRRWRDRRGLTIAFRRSIWQSGGSSQTPRGRRFTRAAGRATLRSGRHRLRVGTLL
jgi:hypothetical protein